MICFVPKKLCYALLQKKFKKQKFVKLTPLERYLDEHDSFLLHMTENCLNNMFEIANRVFKALNYMFKIDIGLMS